MAKRKGSTGLQVALRYKRFTELRKQGLKVEDIGKMAGYDHSTVSYGLKMYNQNQSIHFSLNYSFVSSITVRFFTA